MNVSAHRTSRWIAAAVIAALAAAFLLAMLFRGAREPVREPDSADAFGVSPFELLAASVDEDFPQPPSRWRFEFPADHGAHAEYRTEWWYLSGTLSGGSGTDVPRLGMQWLLMRVALRAQPEPGSSAEAAPAAHASAWSTSQIYAGLFSISASSGSGLRTDGKLSRGAVGLAGATAQPVRVWIENWQLAELDGTDASGFTLRLAANDIELDLELSDAKPPVTAGDLAGSGAAQAAPFQFYAQPRLHAQGTLVMDGRRFETDGLFSFEHAWGELPLPGGPVGNDRFALHLDDGRELILLRTHRTRAGVEGTASTTGLLVDSNGSAVPLAGDGVRLEPIDHWTSSRTGTRYPIRWRLQVPDRDVDVTLRSPLTDQEGEAWLPFWGGPIEVDGSAAGTGFVQLHGYGER